MKPEEQRIAIANFCGWRQLFQHEHQTYLRFSPPITREPEYKYGCYIQGIGHTNIIKKEYLVDELPDYLNDLNAMAEAESLILLSQRQNYWDNLGKICQHRYFTEAGITVGATCCISATAAQRAEAFLKSLNLWSV